MTPAIEVRQVHKRFGALHALCGIDLEINRGEFFALLGPNGAGKTIDQYEIASIDRRHAGIMHDPDFVDSLRVHDKYKSVVAYADGGWDLNNEEQWAWGRITMTALARRKCKGGLNWITRNTLRHIHFCLHRLDLEAAARKNYDGTNGGIADKPTGKAFATPTDAKARSITGAELVGSIVIEMIHGLVAGFSSGNEELGGLMVRARNLDGISVHRLGMVSDGVVL